MQAKPFERRDPSAAIFLHVSRVVATEKDLCWTTGRQRRAQINNYQ